VIYALDGNDLKAMVAAALAWLRQHQAKINALNVFPVPDGDTGTNMSLTMTSAWKEISDVEEENIGQLAGKMAHGALMGARGNSGVILSQIWRGFARGLDAKEQMRAADLAVAMREATETAYKGVVKPVEGTILTVVREVAEETSVAAQEMGDLELILRRMVEHAQNSVARTPSLLPVLQQAGVVDAGGQGLLVILEGMWRHIAGLPVEGVEATEVVEPLAAPAPKSVPEIRGVAHEDLDFDAAHPYDVQFILTGQRLDVMRIREDIESMGVSSLIVGDAETIKVHVHVGDPGVPLSYGVRQGALQDVVVENMQVQYQAFVRDRALAPPATLIPNDPTNIGVVVVAAGEGLIKVFQSLGATSVIEGGQTMNPSTAEILEAVERVPADKVIILPNNKNVLMAAQQACEVSEKMVAVVPTRTIPQGVCALLALDQNATLDGNVSAMLRATQDVVTGEVTWATRNVELNGVAVHEGDAIGLLDDHLVVDTDSFDEAVYWLLAEVNLEDRELVTLYYGDGVAEPQASQLVEKLTDAYPDLEFEVIEGGQPHYPYIISIE
jgi:hypothetical protein